MVVSLRALIVDDEPLASERLRKMLEAEPTVQVIGASDNGREALMAVRRDTPDLVFLDVHMREMDGFAFIKALPSGPLPLIIVVTAYEQYAARAFEAQAVDYLLKPFDRERLRRTLRRAQERIQTMRALRIDESLAALRLRLTKQPAASRIPVRQNGRIVFVSLDDIDWIGTAHNYAELHTGRSTHLFLSTLSTLEARLPPGQFVRISRSTIINLSRLREVCRQSRGYGVVLRDGTQLAIGATYRHKLDQLLGEE